MLMGIGGQAPDGPDALMRRLRELERRLDALASARSLEAATIGAGGLILDGGTIRSGNYTPGLAGYILNPDGNIEINDLTLRGGIIGNDALANPIETAVVNDQATFDAADATPRMLLSQIVSVPDGFTTALVLIAATMSANRDATTAQPSLQLAAVADASVAQPVLCDFPTPEQHATISHTAAAELTGVSGSFIVGAFGSGAAGFATGLGGTVTVAGSIVFLR